MAEQMKTARRHKIIIDNREKITATGVKKVDFCSEEIIVAQTEQGRMTVKGRGLHIENLSAETGELLMGGYPVVVSYAEAKEKKSFFGRLFK
jgi:YabP family.